MLNSKQILVSLLAIFIIGLFSTVTSKGIENKSQSDETHEELKTLNSNQDYIYYMYSTEKGHYFIQPSQEFENVIFVGINDYKIDANFKIDVKELHHGQKFIGTFADETVWELIEIKQLN